MARTALHERGYHVPLDDIAKAAGVGPGTLYRHFATREALLDAVMQAWVDDVGDAVSKVLAYGGTPRELLLRWFEFYVHLISQHKGAAAIITIAMEDETSPIRSKCQVLRAANAKVIHQLREDLRPGTDSLQLARLAGGIAGVVDDGNLSAESLRAMLDVVVDGLLTAPISSALNERHHVPGRLRLG